MRRREFITLLGGAAAAWPLAARAQQPAMPVIGFLSGRTAQSDAPFVDSFRHGLSERGFVIGQNARIEFRWSENRAEQLPLLAADLVRRQVAVICAGGGSAPAIAAKAATASIPIVFANGSDPVKGGLVASLNRPGGNVTGVSFQATEILSKRLELLHEFVPKATKIAVVLNPDNPGADLMSQDVGAAEHALGLKLLVFKARTESEIDAALASVFQQHAEALFIGGDTLFNALRAKFIVFATSHSLPAMFDVREFAADGGLISYGASQTDAYRQMGNYVGRILKGEKPSDLPVLLPTKFETVINLKTAKALGLTVPDKLLVAADEVIE